MIQKIIGTLCLLFFSTATFAQLLDANRAIIYTHDGSVFIGHIIYSDELTVDLVAVTGDTLHIQKGLIKGYYRNSENMILHRGGKMHYTEGYFVSSTLGWGGNFDESPSFDWDLIVGKRLTKRVSVGIGTSLSLNSAVLPGLGWGWFDHHFMPIFGYGRYYLNDKKVRLFASSRLGYGFPTNIIWNDDHQGGLHFQPGVGIHFASRKSGRFIITLSQMIQQTGGSRTDLDVFSNPVNFNYTHWYNRTMLKIGVEFK